MKKNHLKAAAFFAAVLSLLVSCAKPGDSLIEQGIAAYSKGEYEKSLSLFNQALEVETRYSDELIFNFIANVYAAQEDFLNSALYLEKALAAKPDYRGFVTLGMNYQTMGDFSKAEEAYKNAVSLNEKKGEAFASLGILYYEEGRDEEAYEFLIKGAELSPRIAVIHAHLAVVCAKTGRFEEAAEELKTAEDLQCVNLSQFEEKIENFKNAPQK